MVLIISVIGMAATLSMLIGILIMMFEPHPLDPDWGQLHTDLSSFMDEYLQRQADR